MNYRTSYDQVRVPVATKKNIDKMKSQNSLKVSEVEVVLEKEAEKAEGANKSAAADDPESGEVAEYSSCSSDDEKKNWYNMTALQFDDLMA
jgi:hypothetical protein